jgi:RNA polymerase sigma-70 factor, ECF subfamily
LGHGTVEDPHKRFETYVLPYLDLLYRGAIRLAGHEADAEDLVQESCLRAFAAIDRLRDTESCKAWLFKIMRSTYLRHWAEDQYRQRVVGVEDLESTLADMTEVLQDPYESDPLYVHVVGVEVRKAISALPLPYREAVVLADAVRFTYREMSQILDIPLGTVMSRLYRGRRMLRAALRDYASRGHVKQRAV